MKRKSWRPRLPAEPGRPRCVQAAAPRSNAKGSPRRHRRRPRPLRAGCPGLQGAAPFGVILNQASNASGCHEVALFGVILTKRATRADGRISYSFASAKPAPVFEIAAALQILIRMQQRKTGTGGAYAPVAVRDPSIRSRCSLRQDDRRGADEADVLGHVIRRISRPPATMIPPPSQDSVVRKLLEEDKRNHLRHYEEDRDVDSHQSIEIDTALIDQHSVCKKNDRAGCEPVGRSREVLCG